MPVPQQPALNPAGPLEPVPLQPALTPAAPLEPMDLPLMDLMDLDYDFDVNDWAFLEEM